MRVMMKRMLQGLTKELAVRAPHAEPPVASAEGLNPNKFMRRNLVKQSGVPGVLWNRTCFAWGGPDPEV